MNSACRIRVCSGVASVSRSASRDSCPSVALESDRDAPVNSSKVGPSLASASSHDVEILAEAVSYADAEIGVSNRSMFQT